MWNYNCKCFFVALNWIKIAGVRCRDFCCYHLRFSRYNNIVAILSVGMWLDFWFEGACHRLSSYIFIISLIRCVLYLQQNSEYLHMQRMFVSTVLGRSPFHSFQHTFAKYIFLMLNICAEARLCSRQYIAAMLQLCSTYSYLNRWLYGWQHPI